MTRFTVVWRQDALDQLAQCWLDAPHRGAITISVQIVEEVLGRNPKAAGEHLSEGLYKVVAGVLRVLYTIREQEQTVCVESVRPA